MTNASRRIVAYNETRRDPALPGAPPMARRSEPREENPDSVRSASGSDPAHAEDLALVRSILEGSSTAWRDFVERYSGLIHAVVRRYLYSVGPDEVQSLFVDALESLRNRKLATYEGRAALSTWLTLVVRTEVLDHLRRRFGRREVPLALRKLGEMDRTIFRLYYVEGHGFGEVRARLGRNGEPLPISRMLAALRRIEDRLDSRWLRRLSYDLHAQSTGAASGRLLLYLAHVRREFQENAGAHSPDYHLMQREAQKNVARVQTAIERLGEEDRKILTLRYERGWSAKRIAEELGLPSPRGVYTVLDSIVRRLRRQLGGSGEKDS